jgi:hypothetical protein
MNGEGLAKALWFIFLCFFSWPFIGAADRAASFLGIPSIIVYLFLGWAALVVLLAVVSRKLEA